MEVDKIITNVRVFNSFLKKFEWKDVAILNGKFFSIGIEASADLKSDIIIDANENYMIPGLIDIHMHIESSMVPPSIFSKAGLTHGVTTIVADAHEIVNVFGVEGMDAFMNEETEMDIFYAIPSSVPSTIPALETTGGFIGVEKVQQLLNHSKVIALGEAMNFDGIVNDPNSLIRQILQTVQEKKPFMPIEGHVPLVSGMDLAKFMYQGITADHTQQSPESIYEKISSGMFIELQRKSLTKENMELVVNNQFYEYCAIVTDDIMADELLNGHLNANVQLAIEAGVPVEQAIYMSTYTPARRMSFQDRGAIASGFKADFILLEDPATMEASAVYKAGNLVHKKGDEINYPETKPVFPDFFYSSVHCEKVTCEDFRIQAEGKSAVCNVIRIAEVGTFTECVQREIPIKNGYLDWESSGLALIAVMERYGKSGNTAYGLVENALTEKGAIGTTWAHDHHNLMVMGTSIEDLVVAQNKLVEIQGGYLTVENETVISCCPLLIGGIISDAPIQIIGQQLSEVRQGMIDLGYRNANEIMSFSTLSLPVSPAIKITDKGLFDVRSQRQIPLVEEIK
ncbi:adenine deaminase C-terminal domain-containing protein [Carnobacterium sp.]|uniref:adenine deaminase C-terminal domain-containing protein n=1 Tax=Carnobacterium sp. TaxID=48221 RepID=UPI00388F0974